MRDTVPPVWFLRDRAADVVVTKERCECGELHPPIAEFFVGVPYYRMEVVRHQCPNSFVLLRWPSRTKTASICPNHRNLEELELQYSLDAMVQVRPLAPVISQLMAVQRIRVPSALLTPKVPRTQCPVHLPEPAKVEREIKNGRFPGCSSRKTRFVARDMRCPNKL